MITYIFMRLTAFVKYGDEENPIPKEIVDIYRNGILNGEFKAYKRISALRKPVCPKSLFEEFSGELKSEIVSEYGSEDFLLIEYDSDSFDEDYKILSSLSERCLISYCICKRIGFEYKCTLYKHLLFKTSTIDKSFVIFATQEYNGISRSKYIDSISPEFVSGDYTVEDAIYVLNERVSKIIMQIAIDAGFGANDCLHMTLNDIACGYDLKKIISTYSKRNQVAQGDFI